ncbi:MAG: glycine cleavage system protein GcvH [Lentisphaerales bacterium]|jgi:glycine cleavage system H protein|nr:MAG: glycine cleavage system protein GcvH [Lentisphaerales bacterium]
MVPDELYYTAEHAWVRLEGNTAVVGITDYAQDKLGNVTFVELPEVGRTIEQNDEIAVVESVKAASEVYSPLPGNVSSVNTELQDNPELLNTDPFGDGWICKLNEVDKTAVDVLLSPDRYADLTQDKD